MTDLKFDLEHTRQWAIAAEKDLLTMKARALYAEGQVKAQEKATQASGLLQAKIYELTKVVEELEGDVEYWHTSHTRVISELAEAKDKIDEANLHIEELVRERDALYASLG